MRMLHIVQGKDKVSFFPFINYKLKLSGKPFGSKVQIPSVSSSRGIPI